MRSRYVVAAAACALVAGTLAVAGAVASSAASDRIVAASTCERVGVLGTHGLPQGRLQGVAAAPGGDIWAVGYSDPKNAPLIVRVRGGRAQKMPLPPLPHSSTGHDLRGVVAPAADAAWAVGDGVVFRWDGHRWRRTDAPQGVYNAVDATSRRDVWAVGTPNQGGFMAAHWNGEGWRRIPGPSRVQLVDYPNAVLALGPRDVWVVGGPPPFAAHWNGISWTSYAMPDNPDETYGLDSVVKGPSDTVYAAGGGGMYVWSNGAWAATNYGLYHDYNTTPIAARGSTFWGISGSHSDRVVRLDGSAWAPAGKQLWGAVPWWLQIAADSNGGAWAVGWTNPPKVLERPAIGHYHC